MWLGVEFEMTSGVRVKVLAEDLADHALELHSRNGSYSSVQMANEPNPPQVDLLIGCGLSPGQEKTNRQIFYRRVIAALQFA